MDIIARSASTMWALVNGGTKGAIGSLRYVPPVCALIELSEWYSANKHTCI